MIAYTLLDDAELLTLVSHDNEKAYTEIYNRYWKKLFTITANKLGNLHEAEELVQDIFLDIWNRRKIITVKTSLSSYLSVAVNYKVLNVLARRSLSLRYSKYLSVNNMDIDRSTELWLNFEELKKILDKLVSALPEKCRLVYQLSRDKGLSQKEIALTLKIAEKTVEAHLSRALHSLRTVFNMILIFL